eukprot:m51a1_g1603 hypothetical protein (512) ;mRNA; f:179899-181591
MMMDDAHVDHVQLLTVAEQSQRSVVVGAEPEPTSPTQTRVYPVEWRRWYVLGLFCFISSLQSVVWFTYSSVPREVKEYYGVTDHQIDMLLNWGSMTALVFGLPVAWLFSSLGLRPAVLLGAALVFACSALRSIPCLAASTPAARLAMLPLMNFAQTLNGVAGPIVLTPVALLSSTWFPECERATATAIGVLANGLAMPIAWLAGPMVVTSADKFPRLIYIEAAACAVPFAMALAHFPAQPVEPPSASAEETRRLREERAREVGHRAVAQGFINAARTFGRELLVCSRSAAFWTILFINGTYAGVLCAFGAALARNIADQMTTAEIGWVGFGKGLASLLGNYAVGKIVDLWFRRRMKAVCIAVYAFTGLTILWFSLIVPSVFSDRPLLPTSKGLLFFVLALYGFASSADPVSYELAAEVTYPVTEGTSTGLIMSWCLLSLVIMLFALSSISAPWLNVIVCVTMFACAIGMLFVRETYKRQDVGLKKEEAQTIDASSRSDVEAQDKSTGASDM